MNYLSSSQFQTNISYSVVIAHCVIARGVPGHGSVVAAAVNVVVVRLAVITCSISKISS